MSCIKVETLNTHIKRGQVNRKFRAVKLDDFGDSNVSAGFLLLQLRVLELV